MAHYPLAWPTLPRKHYPNIGEVLQRTRSLPINSVCFPERNTSKTAFHRIIIGSGWILTKAPNPFMLEKPRLKFLWKKSPALPSSFSQLHSSYSLLLNFFSFRFQPLLCLTLAMDRQLVSGSQSRWKMQIHLWQLFVHLLCTSVHLTDFSSLYKFLLFKIIIARIVHFELPWVFQPLICRRGDPPLITVFLKLWSQFFSLSKLSNIKISFHI